MKIVFCIPGRIFSGNFLTAWSDVIYRLYHQGISVQLINRYSSNVYYARNMCLGGDNLAGVKQKPWQGKLDYDYMIWLDSDMVFTFAQIERLLLVAKKYKEVQILSGIYPMENKIEYATVIDWDLDVFTKNGRFHFVTKDEVSAMNKNTLVEVAYTGFGFMLIKNGVVESMEYPWFRPHWHEMTVNDVFIRDYTSEDVGFCRSVTELGYKIYIDPSLIIGHEKAQILR